MSFGVKSKSNTNVFENESVIRSILIMAVPTVLSQLISVIYNYADAIYIGKLNNPSEVAAIALATPLTLFITAVSNLWGIGGGSAVSRSAGAGKKEEAARISSFSAYGAAILTLLCSFMAFIMGESFTRLLGASDTVLPYAEKYIFWVFIIGAFPSVMSQVLAHLARSEGHSAAAAAGLTIGVILNIALDPLFIFDFGLGLGVEGAAIATAISNFASFLFFVVFFILRKSDTNLSFSPRKMLPTKEIAGTVLLIGLPSALISLLSAISNVFLNNIVAAHGDVAEAAVGIAKKIDILPAHVAMGITQGSLPLLAYSYGKGDHDRTRKILRETCILACSVIVFIVILLEIFARPIASIFIEDRETVRFAASFLRKLCISIPFYSITITINSYFQAANKKWHALFLSVLRKGIFDIPLMFLLDAAAGSVTSVILAQPIMDVIVVAVSIVMIRKK